MNKAHMQYLMTIAGTTHGLVWTIKVCSSWIVNRKSIAGAVAIAAARPAQAAGHFDILPCWFAPTIARVRETQILAPETAPY